MKQINNDNSSGTQIGIQNNYYQTGDKNDQWNFEMKQENKLDHKVRKRSTNNYYGMTTKTPNHYAKI